MNFYPTTYLPQRAQRNFIDLKRTFPQQTQTQPQHFHNSNNNDNSNNLFSAPDPDSPQLDTATLIARYPFLLPVLETPRFRSSTPTTPSSSVSSLSRLCSSSISVPLPPLLTTTEELARNEMLKQIDHFSSVLDDLEAKREKTDNVEGLRSLQRRVNGGSKINFTKPGRKLLHQGKVLVVDSSRTKPKERQLVLLSDILLLLKEKKRVMSKKDLSIVKLIPLNDANLNDISIVGQEHSFMVYTPDRVGIFSTQSKYDKFNWMRLVQECINGSYNKDKTTHLTSCASDDTDELENLEDFSASSSSSQTCTPRGEKEEDYLSKSFGAPENTIEVTVLTT